MVASGVPASQHARPAFPYRAALRTAIASAFVAGFVVALADLALTVHHARGVRMRDVAELALLALPLYALAALLFGCVEGVVVGAIRATLPAHFGTRLWRRLREDAALDRQVLAWLVAGGVVALLYGGAVTELAIHLVKDTNRKLVGSVLCGVGAVALLPLAVLAAFPLFRLARRMMPQGRRSPGVPRSVWFVAAVVVGGAILIARFVAARLDWRELNLGPGFTLLGFLAAQWGALWLGKRWALERSALAVGLVLVFLAPVVVLLRPRTGMLALLEQDGLGLQSLVGVVRRLGDRDHDGWSRLLGGGDCNDRDPATHPGAHDVPDDGIDQNCLGGDAHRIPPAAPPAATSAVRSSGNLLFVLVDTLRADCVGSGLTPHMDALAARGVEFKNARAQAPYTMRSLPSILSSRLPSQLHWQHPTATYPRPASDNVNLFGELRARGLRTEGVASHFYFRSDIGGTDGFDRFENDGAADIEDSVDDTAAPRIIPRALQRLRVLASSGQRFALFVHLFEPHSRYLPHAGFPPRDHSQRARYDAEVAYVDDQLGQLLDGLQALGLGENTVVVLLSDHGEAFGEHTVGGQPYYFHGNALYDEVLRVPLVIAVPGVAPRKIDQPIMLMDVAPTLLDVLTGEMPAAFRGRSLAPALAGAPIEPRPSFAELPPVPLFPHSARAWLDGGGRIKLLYKETEALFELYDLSVDPGEKHNLIDDRPDLAKPAMDSLVRWLDSED